MGCLSRDSHNKYNFFNFRKGSSLLLSEFGSPISTCSDSYTKLPNQYRLINKPYYPKIVKDATFNIYVNFTTAITSDPASWTVRIVDLQGTELNPTDLSLVKHTISTGNYRISLEGDINVGVEGRIYQLIIKSSATAVEYVSNCFQLVASSEEANLMKLEYRHSVDLNGFDYDTIWATLYNTVWLDLNEVDVQQAPEIDEYREGSTGRVRRRNTLTADFSIIEAHMFDDAANEAMRSLFYHDDIKLNGNVVRPKSAYKKTPNRRNSRESGTMEFWLEDSMTVNLNG